ncbi:MAG: DUF4314 domain-containing protein [Ruminococcus sp.]|nr:DUF4314 domain-containing protein [Ruminococcus sp.]
MRKLLTVERNGKFTAVLAFRFLRKIGNDPYPVPPGTVGTVQYVDDAGNIHTVWSNGWTLAVIEGVDDFSKASFP